MVIILGVLFIAAVSRLEQEVAGSHLEEHAREGPVVRRRIVFGSDNDFRGPILSRLNLGREMMVRPASITEIANLKLQRFIQFLAALVGPLFLDLLLHCLRVEHFFVEVQSHRIVAEWISARAIIGLLCPLTLLEFLSVKNELFNRLLFMLYFLDIVLVAVRDLDAALLIEQLGLDELSLLQLCQVFVSQCLRSEVRRRVEHMLRQCVRPRHFNVLFQNFINLTHLFWIQILKTEWLLRFLIILLFLLIVLFLVLKRLLLLLRSRLVHLSDAELARCSFVFCLIFVVQHVWALRLNPAVLHRAATFLRLHIWCFTVILPLHLNALRVELFILRLFLLPLPL